MTLPSDPTERKSHPITSGVLDYFPDAIAEVAHASFIGNEQHHAGEPLHWDKSKSTDEADCLVRHLMQRGTLDSDGVRHTAKVAWRALALLQRELESEQAEDQRAELRLIGMYPEDERSGSLQDTPKLVDCIPGCRPSCKQSDPDIHTPEYVAQRKYRVA